MVHGVVWHTMGHDVEGIGKGVMEDSTILMIYGGPCLIVLCGPFGKRNLRNFDGAGVHLWR